MKNLWHYLFPEDKHSKQIYSARKIHWLNGKKIFLHRFVFDSPQGTEKIKFYILACHVNHFKTFGQSVIYILVYVYIHTHNNKCIPSNYMTLEKVLNLLQVNFSIYIKYLYHICIFIVLYLILFWSTILFWRLANYLHRLWLLNFIFNTFEGIENLIQSIVNSQYSKLLL